MNLNRRVLGLLVLVALAQTGCNNGPVLPKTVTADGIVTLDGTPVENATVVFIADSGTYNATGNSDKNGKFSMRAFQEKKGAVPGSYKVEINKTIVESGGDKGGEAVVNLKQGLPKKYATFTTSGLTFTIPESGTSDIKFELKSK